MRSEIRRLVDSANGAVACGQTWRSSTLLHRGYNKNFCLNLCSDICDIAFSDAFKPGKSKGLPLKKVRVGRLFFCCVFRDCNTVLLMFLNSVIYRIYSGRSTFWGERCFSGKFAADKRNCRNNAARNGKFWSLHCMYIHHKRHDNFCAGWIYGRQV